MSLTTATNIAISALNSAQYQMTLASANIANSDTPGYTEKSAALQSVSMAGSGIGVSSGAVTSLASNLLTSQLAVATAANSAATTNESYYQQLTTLYGSTTSSSSSSTSGTSLVTNLDQLTTDLTNLAATPESNSLKQSVVSDLENTTAQMNGLSTSFQQLRRQADQGIQSSVSDANAQLKSIANLNAEILAAKGTGASIADLQDQQSQAVLNLSQDMNVRYSINDNGAMQVYSGDGSQMLVSNSGYQTLKFAPSNAMTSSNTYPATLSGVTVNGHDITSSITSGRISALVSQRDTVVPNAQSELDNLAMSLKARLNAVSNEGTSSPAANTLTGDVTVASTDTFSGSGTARVAVVDSKGNLVSSEDLNLSSFSTVGDVVNALNGISGVTASINSSGRLVVSASNSSYGISFGALTSSVGSNDQSLSGYFGLNDIVTGTNASDIGTATALTSASSGLPTVALSSSSSLTAGSNVLPSGDTTIADAYEAVMTSTQSFTAAGGLPAQDGTFANYMSASVTDKTTALTSATTAADDKTSTYNSLKTAQTSASGVNTDDETQRLTDMQTLYQLAAKVMTTAETMLNTLISDISGAT